MAGYALVQLLTICKSSAAIEVARTPWRHPDTVTAGMLNQFRIRDCWNRYEQKLRLELLNKNESDSILAASLSAEPAILLI